MKFKVNHRPLFSLLRLYFKYFVAYNRRIFRLIQKGKTKPEICRFEILNPYPKQTYMIVEIEVRNAIYMSIDGNSIPVFADDVVLKIKIPIQNSQNQIQIKIRGVFGIVSEKKNIPCNQKVKFKSMNFNRIGHISNSFIKNKKREPSEAMKYFLGRKDPKTKNREPSNLCQELKLQHPAFKGLRTLKEMKVRNFNNEIQTDLIKNTIYEK